MTFLLPFLIACITALCTTPLVIYIYTKFHLLEDPKKNPHPKVVHDRPLPRGGGIVIFTAVLIATLFFLPVDKHIIGILGGALFLMLIGIWDDIANPHPLARLAAQIVAALIVIGSGIGIAYITNPFGGVILLNQPQIAFTLFGSLHTIWIFSDLLALVWIVWCMNIVNFSKGLDGQMPGYVTISP